MAFANPRRPNGAGNIHRSGYVIHKKNGIDKAGHVLVAERALGHALPKDAVVHHVNEVKSDNRGENLVICPNRAYHVLIHRRMRALAACSNADWRKCCYCKAHDDTTMMIKSRHGFVHRKCETENRVERRVPPAKLSTITRTGAIDVGWSIGFDENWKRDIGYGVPATCDHPGCVAEIDRGLSYVCGGQPYGGDRGCGLYFCQEHLRRSAKLPQLCTRCLRLRGPYEPTPDTAEWIEHKRTDQSWQQWRDEQVDAIPTNQHSEGSMISAAEAAIKLGVTPRRVQALCQQGRIPGAHRHLHSWQLPDNPTVTPRAYGPKRQQPT